MKKTIIALLTVCLLSLFGVAALASYPQTTADWKVIFSVNPEDGSVTIKYDASEGGQYAVDNVEIAIYDTRPDFTGMDMTNGGPYDVKIDNGGTNHPTERVLTVGSGVNAYPFEEGRTYYVTLMRLAGGSEWTWNTRLLTFNYSADWDPTDEPEQPTGDFSSIAFAAAAIAGCGALAVRRNKR